MATYITDIIHYDEFSEEPGGGTSYLNGNVGGKHISTIEGYFYRAALDKYLRFSPDGTIENINELDGDSWIDLGFVVGATISVSGSASNDGTYILTGVTDTVLSTGETFVDEDAESVDIYDDTQVTCVDFYYNIIENSEGENYYSKTDAGAIQRFNNTSYDATGEVGSPQNMFVSSDSWGWVTNTLVDTNTGETDQVRITNVETVAHKQYFLINHIFFIAPFWLNDQVQNFENEVPPDYLNSGRSLKYIARVDGNTSCGCGDANHTGSATSPNGCVAWFDQNNKKTRADYYCESITYFDGATELDALDINKVVTVTITLKSRTGQFQFDPLDTRIIAAFTYAPLNTDRYVFTPDTLLRENFINDRCNVLANAGQTDGDFFGTDYQVLTGVQATCASTTTLTVTFDVDFSTALKTFFEGLEKNNRKYFITVMTQDIDITTTNQNDRVNVLCDYNEIEWDKDIDDLIAPFDDLNVNQFPETDASQDSNNVSGYEGDPVVVRFPFGLLQHDTLDTTLLSAKMEIVAVKTDRDDFVLEGKTFDTSLVRKYNGVQTVDMSETRDYKDMIDYYKDITLVRDATYDTTGATDYAGFIFNYPFVLRYEYWADLIQQADEYQYDIFEDIESPTQAWDTLQANGWELQVKFTGVGQAYEGHEQTYTQYWDITVAGLGEAPESGPILTCTKIFEDTVEEVQVEGIVEGGETLITTIWKGDFSSLPATDIYAYIFADYDGGGVYNRRFASSEFDSDSDSPFSAPDYDLTGYTQAWQTDNMKMYISGTSAVIIQTVYDDALYNWTKTYPELLILPRIGFYDGCFVLNEDGTYTLDENGERINTETC